VRAKAALLLLLLLLLSSTAARAPMPEPDVDVGVRFPRVVRVETTNSSRRAIPVRELLGERFDVATLPPRTPLTLWIEQHEATEKLVAFRIDVDGAPFLAMLAQVDDPGLCGQGCEVFVDDDGVTLAGRTLASPVDAWTVSSRVGVREHPISHRRRFHAGTDYAAPIGTPVLSVQDGVVVRVARSWTAGRFVVVLHDDGSEAKYLHLDAQAVTEKQRLHKGELVGVVGQTGRVTGPHLHFELRDRQRCPLDMTVARWPGRAQLDDESVRALRLRKHLLDQPTTSWAATIAAVQPPRRSAVDVAGLMTLLTRVSSGPLRHGRRRGPTIKAEAGTRGSRVSRSRSWRRRRRRRSRRRCRRSR
jgi:murein DD-endopeptidase MepM/ murein hydrolase activator NlpD